MSKRARKAPAVSVVVPVFNCADKIGRALASVAAQSFKDFEVIVVDDASTDQLDRALEVFSGLEPRLLRHETNQGAGAARNTGCRAARGRYIAFLDADDVWMPEKLERQMAVLERDRNGGRACYTGYIIQRNGDAEREVRLLPLDTSDDQLGQLMFGCNISPGSTLLVERTCFEEVGPFNEELRRLEDWDWLIRCAGVTHLENIAEPLVRIEVTDPPAARSVLNAIDRLRGDYLDGGKLKEPVNRRRFRSTLYLEKAAAHHRHGAVFLPLYYGVRSVLAYPTRNRAFFQRMAWHVFRTRQKPAQAPIAGKVVHVITGLDTGGAERSLASLVLANRGKKVPPVVVALSGGGHYEAELTQAGVRVIDLGMNRKLPSPFAVVRLARILKRERPEVVQSWMYHADLMAYLALKLSGRRRWTKLFWGVRCSNMDLSKYGPRLRMVIRLCARLSGRPDAVVANSDAGREFHLALGYRPRRFVVIDNGIDLDRFDLPADTEAAVRGELGIPKGAPVVASIARVDPMKDYDTFLDAFARLDDAHALVAGANTGKLPEQARLHRLGRRDDVPRLLAASDILVSSSAFGEGFSNAIAEGMASGLPVVATDVGDARRIADGAGIIVPPNDPKALAEAIGRLLDDPALRRRLGAIGRKRIAEQYSLDRMVRAFDEIHGDARGGAA